jgi:DNA invertase Pin-like site-specific DNA recombinase
LKDLVSKMKTLEDRDVDFVSVTEGIDIYDRAGEIHLSCLEAPWPSSSGSWAGRSS